MITTIVLGVISVVCLLILIWVIHENNKRTKEMMKAIMAKSLNEFTESEIVEKQPDKPVETTEPDIVEMSTLGEEEFDNIISSETERLNE